MNNKIGNLVDTIFLKTIERDIVGAKNNKITFDNGISIIVNKIIKKQEYQEPVVMDLDNFPTSNDGYFYFTWCDLGVTHDYMFEILTPLRKYEVSPIEDIVEKATIISKLNKKLKEFEIKSLESYL